jgi:hypothetical protein
VGASSAGIEEYLIAARNKIGIARRYLGQLNELRRGEESEREEIQMNFEGVIGSGASAADQLAEGLALRLGLRVRNASPERVLEALSRENNRPRGEACVGLLRAWTRDPIVSDTHRRRNRAVHHHYRKRPDKLELTWLLDPVQIAGEDSPYHGSLDVHTYCANYVAALKRLEALAACIESST